MVPPAIDPPAQPEPESCCHAPAALTPVRVALDALLARVEAVDTSEVGIDDAAGRILALAVHADRAHPPQSVSAMDGWAVRHADLQRAEIPVRGEAPIGQSPLVLPEGAALRIFTGAPIPKGADTVLRREDGLENAGMLRVQRHPAPRANIRFQGENAERGAQIVRPGSQLGPAALAALATFGAAAVAVHRKLKVAVIVTGNELLSTRSQPAAHQLRDANGPLLRGLLQLHRSWIEPTTPIHAPDDPRALSAAIGEQLNRCDALFITGGVSMGDHDYVPRCVREVGAHVVFHKVAARPGKPTLGAHRDGKPILGLPGNPQASLVMAHLFGLPLLRKRAGFRQPRPVIACLKVERDSAELPLLWARPVRVIDDVAHLIPTRGSGDIPALGGCDGFVLQRPGDPSAWMPFLAM